MHNLKSLARLKKQREQEERAFESLKKADVHLAKFTDVEILQFFGLKKREEIVGYNVEVKRSSASTPDTHRTEATCLCQDSMGNGKLLYSSYEEAEKKSVFLKRDKQLNLKVYACPTTNGWHLSKV